MMEIYFCTVDFLKESTHGINDDLNMASEPVTSLGDCTSRQKCKHSLYPGAQLLSVLLGSSVCIPLKCAPHIKAHQVEVRWVRRPDLRWCELEEVVRNPPLRLPGDVAGCTILLQDKWLLSDGFLDLGLHYLLLDIQADLFCSPLAPGERCGGREDMPFTAEHPKHNNRCWQLVLHHPGHILSALGQPPVNLAV